MKPGFLPYQNTHTDGVWEECAGGGRNHSEGFWALYSSPEVRVMWWIGQFVITRGEYERCETHVVCRPLWGHVPRGVPVWLWESAAYRVTLCALKWHGWRDVTGLQRIWIVLRYRRPRANRVDHHLVKYRVSMKSYPDYKHILQENYVEYKRRTCWSVLMCCKKDFLSWVSFCFLSVTLRPNVGHGLLILEVSRSHTMTHHSR